MASLTARHVDSMSVYFMSFVLIASCLFLLELVLHFLDASDINLFTGFVCLYLIRWFYMK